MVTQTCKKKNAIKYKAIIQPQTPKGQILTNVVHLEILLKFCSFLQASKRPPTSALSY